jgi:hypothetical protein
MDTRLYTPLYTKLDEQYQKEYSEKKATTSWYSRPHIGHVCVLGRGTWYLDYLDDGISGVSKTLLKSGLEPRPFYTQILDLTQTKEELWRDVRKGHKAIIRKKPAISLIHKGSFLAYSMANFRKLHIEVSGRETRSPKTWGIQASMILHGEAFAMMRYDNGLTAAAFFNYNEHICYYSVGCSVEGTSSHALVWEAILYAKELGCKKFDLGQQVFAGDEKLVNISKFKRGFGGRTIVYLEFKDGN